MFFVVNVHSCVTFRQRAVKHVPLTTVVMITWSWHDV